MGRSPRTSPVKRKSAPISLAYFFAFFSMKILQSMQGFRFFP